MKKIRNSRLITGLRDRFKVFRTSRVVKSSRTMPEWMIPYRRLVYGLAFLALLFLVLESGMQWKLPAWLSGISHALDYIVFATFLFDSVMSFLYTYPKSRFFRDQWMDFLVFAPLILKIISVRAGTGLVIVRHLLVLAKIFTRSRKFSNMLRGVRINTARIVAGSFLATILLGAIVLTFPTATADGKGAGLVDALFTSVSATCVTGLIVQDTPVYWSRFGQVVILVLIQLGGLGIMMYSAFIALLLGRFSLGQKKIVQEMLEEERNIYSMIFYIFKMTFVIESIGAALLFFRWMFMTGNVREAAYLSVFHSVSAFCNAGFSLFSDSLVRFGGDAAVNLIILLLIISGGIGFMVVHEITARARGQKSVLSVHTRLVLSTTVVLVLIGFFAVFYLEYDRVLLKMPLSAKLWTSLFQSVTTRTAGFNTLPIEGLSETTLTLMILLMFIGASPGSTGGGIKTTTLAVLMLSVRSIFRGEEGIRIYRRNIPPASIHKALALLVAALFTVLSAFLILLLLEAKPYLDLLFETVSAFATVGLSTGVTPGLGIAGKILISFLMYLGRIGPLTLGIALARDIRKRGIQYPEARVIIG
ncbi:Trk family potassium uptake protein [bacterium]|nr:Trk family potassium uptake protein [bacterium]